MRSATDVFRFACLSGDKNAIPPLGTRHRSGAPTAAESVLLLVIQIRDAFRLLVELPRASAHSSNALLLLSGPCSLT